MKTNGWKNGMGSKTWKMFFNRFKRPHTEIAEDYWNREYLDYSNKLLNMGDIH